MASHVFVTVKYLDRCVEAGLFGVTVQQVNYLATVAPGDTAFLLETATGRLAGPFSVDAPLFFSQTAVWSTQDTFTYRLRLSGSNVWEGDVSILWRILLRRCPSEWFSFTTFQRSSVGLLGEEGLLLTEELRAAAIRKLTPGTLHIDQHPIDLIQKDNHAFTSEARLEASLLLARTEFLQFLVDEGHLPPNATPAILNQVPLPALNYNVDILVLFENSALVIELKRDLVDKNTCSQLKRYGRYWDACGVRVTLIAIGNAVACVDPAVALYSYVIDRSCKSIRLVRNDKEWHLPAFCPLGYGTKPIRKAASHSIKQL